MSADCDRWRDAIIGRVIGDSGGVDDAALDEHLRICASCNERRRELDATYATLGFASPATDSAAPIPGELFSRVLGDLSRAGARQRHRRLAGSLGAVAATLVLVVVALDASGVMGSSQPSLIVRTDSLRGPGSASGEVILTGRPWGTGVDVRETGLPSGVAYTVSMETTAGTWWVAGSYRPVGAGPIDATMSCAVAADEITGVRVTNAANHTVLSSWYR